MDILNKMKKIPGGLLIIPMLLAAVINTICPQILQIGNPTTALFTNKGTMVLLGLMLFFSGTQCKVSQIKTMIKRSGTLCLVKIIIAYGVGIFINKYFGEEGFWGISVVTIIAVVTSCNPGLYLALVDSYGDEVDASAFGILNLIVVPAVPITILSSTSGQGIDFNTIIATLFPFILGILLGNLDGNFRKLYSSGTAILLPFMGISFGVNINIIVALRAGISGIISTILFYIICLIPLLIIDKKVMKRPGYAATAMSSVAGLSLVVPTLAAELNPVYEKFIQVSIAQIAFVVILTTIITPIITQKIIMSNKINE
ncbi:2-keto-3-deoxygluconate permease [Clostridium sp. BL-8]|uniref:2-keto-3-deoxygluconate permease n=1 Tax=Clostridium sp. BL-8 TaxID=349938 RepID=UPI00098CA227|nr:2-keto-3-deoxygluconate permease [Clostridium sp. BL-8]OOM77499.1 2-keto-3-deoxygluconate permease [Clostridium sp. BL-8]